MARDPRLEPEGEEIRNFRLLVIDASEWRFRLLVIDASERRRGDKKLHSRCSKNSVTFIYVLLVTIVTSQD